MKITEYDKKIIGLVLQGCNAWVISREMRIAKRTAKARLNKLYRFYNCRGRIKSVELLRQIMPPEEKQPVKTELTPREVQVIRHVYQAKTNAQIARDIGTTENMVKNYLR